jgi:hypothetical protein
MKWQTCILFEDRQKLKRNSHKGMTVVRSSTAETIEEKMKL